eukprot:5416036-Pleurochrysis_carterae.AAC.2
MWVRERVRARARASAWAAGQSAVARKRMLMVSKLEAALKVATMDWHGEALSTEWVTSCHSCRSGDASPRAQAR